MISLDWKERLKIDTEDFVNRKLSKNNYDIDIVYNAYPTRVDNKIPSEVINYIAKLLVSLISKQLDQHMGFFDYLWEGKGENGHLIFIHLMKTAVVKKPDIFMNYLKKILTDCNDNSEVKALLKTILPLLKKEPKKYADILYSWLNTNNPALHKGIIELFLKTLEEDPSMLKYLFQKMERGWLYPTPYTIKNSTHFLKAIYKIEPDFYFSVYENYKTSRNPVFVEILCNALNPIEEEENSEKINEYLANWCKSGNIRIKKAALAGQKIIKKKSKH